jgi:cysteine-rich repeat protein
MTEACIRRRVLVALLSSWFAVGCSGNREDALNTHNIGRADSAVLTDEDASDEEPSEESDAGDAGEQVSELDGGAEDGGALDGAVLGGEDAGDFDAIVTVEIADAGPMPDTTVVVETPLCGNGERDPGEDCDQGASNSDTVAGACRTNCRNARCGDGVIDQGEVCDHGAMNSDSEANACRTSCTVARCGDNVVDQGEQCDSGDARSNTAAGACRVDCRSARCGDSVVDNDEGCDDGNTVDNDTCRNNCRTLLCGNMVVDPGEQCDDGNTTNGDGCQATCRTPRCGDRVMDPGEQCDDGNSVENDGCRSNCQNGCVNDAACSDGLFCTGVERCINGLCNAGTGVNPDDSIGCTVDVCREDLDRVTHTANDALCQNPAATCRVSGGFPTGTTSTTRCDVTQGCVSTNTQTRCPDPASMCTRANGTLTLTTYRAACNDAMSCGDGVPTTRGCGAAGASCSNRVFTGAGSCDPNSESCAAGATEDCTLRDRGTCATGNASHSRVTGTCGANGCGTSAPSVTACSDPADACASPTQRVTYTPTCDAANGCGDPIATPETCSARAAECTDNANVRAASIVSYQPSCSGGACVSGGVAQPSALCPANAASCSNGVRTTYRPTCQNGSSCVPGGVANPQPCGVSATTCGTDNALKRPGLTVYSATCSGSDCAQTSRLDYCALTPITCEGNVARTPGTICSGNACGVGSTTCPTTQYSACSTDTSAVEVRVGACKPGEGCGYNVIRTSPCSSCAQVAGAAVLQACSASCGVNSDNTPTCGRAVCMTCPISACELNAAGARTGNLCSGRCNTNGTCSSTCAPSAQCLQLSTGGTVGTVNPGTPGGVVLR